MLCMLDTSAAESKGNLVILGDSISSGYGLDENEYNYGEILGEYLDYDTENFAVPGLSTAGLVEKLSEQNVKDSVSNADIIVISIGGNDFISAAREAFTAQFGDQIGNITDFNELFSILSSQDLTSSLKVLNTLYAIKFPAACNTAISNIESISTTISELNPDAEVVFQNLYDPFQINQTYYDKYIKGNSKNMAGYNGIKRAVYYNINSLKTYDGLNVSFNVKLKDAVGNAHIADICSAFTSDEVRDDDLTQPYGYTSYFTDVFNAADRDFHPNQKGHLEIASAVLEELNIKPVANRKMRLVYNRLSSDEKAAYPELRVDKLKTYASACALIKGDYNNSNSVDAVDASAVLAQYAKQSAAETVEISKDVFVAADVNGDDRIDSADASAILAYYAKLSANEDPVWN